ncbi:hypothetical protein, partial [Paraburkholderia steynii]|uniref:hypothetical protein n=1 Tax=Paraburkholderia steynii TaxID=1245441 RepID=UPI001ABE4E45
KQANHPASQTTQSGCRPAQGQRVKRANASRMPAQNTRKPDSLRSKKRKPKPNQKPPEAQTPNSRLPFFVFYFSSQTTKTKQKKHPNRTGPSQQAGGSK